MNLRHLLTDSGRGVLKTDPPENVKYRFEIYQRMQGGVPGTFRIDSHLTPVGDNLQVYLQALNSNDPIDLELESGEIVQVAVTGMIPLQPDSVRTHLVGGEVLLEKFGLT